MRKKEIRKLDVAGIKFLRSRYGVTGMIRVRNVEQTSRVGVGEKMIDTANQKVLKEFRYVKLMRGYRLKLKVHESNVKGERA